MQRWKTLVFELRRLEALALIVIAILGTAVVIWLVDEPATRSPAPPTQTSYPPSRPARPVDDAPHWNCSAEDFVVVIDDTCRHIDELQHP